MEENRVMVFTVRRQLSSAPTYGVWYCLYCGPHSASSVFFKRFPLNKILLKFFEEMKTLEKIKV